MTPVCQQHARVLIVDGEPATICQLEEFLRGTATEFRSVSDSRQVEIAFEEFAPDIVLLNLQMPCINQVVQRVSNLLQARELFAELAAGYVALERDQQNQPRA
jgi:CheY-like chemotaxis protein